MKAILAAAMLLISTSAYAQQPHEYFSPTPAFPSYGSPLTSPSSTSQQLETMRLQIEANEAQRQADMAQQRQMEQTQQSIDYIHRVYGPKE